MYKYWEKEKGFTKQNNSKIYGISVNNRVLVCQLKWAYFIVCNFKWGGGKIDNKPFIFLQTEK